MSDDEERQEATPEQRPGGGKERVLLELLGGATVTEAAAAAGVARQTLSGWVNRDPAFRAALANGRAELRAALMRRVEGAMGEALAVVRELLHQGEPKDRLAAARLLLGLLPSLPPARRTTPEDEAHSLELDHQAAEERWGMTLALRAARLYEEDDPGGRGGLPLRRKALPLP